MLDLSGMQNPQFMLGLTMLSASHSKDPQAALNQGLAQYQSMIQQQRQQQYQNAQLAIQQSQLGLAQNADTRAENVDKRAQDEVNRNLTQGAIVANDVIGQNPSAANGWQAKGLIGSTASVKDNSPAYAALGNPDAQAGTPFDIQEKIVSNKVDPVTLAKYQTAAALASAGQLPQAAAALPAYPQQFSLSPGQTQYSASGEVIASAPDAQKNIGNAKDLRSQYNTDSKMFQDYGDTYARFNTGKQDPVKGTDATKDKVAMTNLIKMINPNAKINNGEVVGYEDMGTLSDQFKQQYQQIVKGGRLTPDARKELYRQGDELYQAQAERQKGLVHQYSEIAQRMGVDPKDVIIDYGVSSQNRSDAPKTGEIPTFTDGDFAQRDARDGLPPGTSKSLYLRKANQGKLK